MIIALSFLTETDTGENKNFIYENFNRIAGSHLEHTFIFISNKTFSNRFIFSKNVIPVVIPYAAKTPLKWLLWYNIKIPKVLRKYKADVFVSEKYSSLTTKMPQVLISPDLSFIHQPTFAGKKERFFYKKFIPLFLKKAKRIIVYSEFAKAEIVKQYKINSAKIEVVSKEVNENFKPANFEEREIIKEKYAGGNEYFIYSGIISPQKNLLNLLKAFSALKKRQRSNMQLIIAGKPGKQYAEFVKALDLYRFKKEVKLFDNLPFQELVKLTASAYSMVYPSPYETSAAPPLESMKCEVPVIAALSGSLPEICGEAALYFDPENPKDIAGKMMLVFKDENFRKELIEKGNALIKKYSCNNSADLFWKNILSALQ